MLEGSSCIVRAESPLHVVQCSQQFAAFFGYSKEELISKSLGSLSCSDFGTASFENLMKTFDCRKHTRSEVSALRKDGSSVRTVVDLFMQKRSTGGHGHCTVLISLCDAYQNVADDDEGDSKLQNIDVQSLNSHRPCNQLSRTRSDAVRFYASNETHHDRPDLEQDREFLRLIISKASCQVIVVLCLVVDNFDSYLRRSRLGVSREKGD